MVFLRRRPVEERFREKVNKDGPIPAHRPDIGSCWVWIPCHDAYNRPSFNIGYKLDGTQHRVLAYRFSFEEAYGPIPVGAFVCHHCDNPICVRPSHLFLGDQRANMLDASLKGRIVPGNSHGAAHYLGARTHCKNGHPFDETNSRPRKSGGRVCLTCQHLADQKRYAAHPERSRSRRKTVHRA
jgi:hypothetical protein